MSAILAALQRLEKLVCSNSALGTELKECLYSQNTLTTLSKLLISQDYDEYIKEMTDALTAGLEKSHGSKNV